MPNTFAYIVLFSWPLVMIILFRKLPVSAAIAWSIIGGYLLLPGRTGFNLPMVPTIDKDAVPSLMAVLLALLVAGGAAEATRRRKRAEDGQARAEAERRVRAYVGPSTAPETVVFRSSLGGKVMAGLVVLACGSILLTVITNPDPVLFGPKFIPGLRLYDAGSVLANVLIALIPFFLARRYLATPHSHVVLLSVLCIAGLVYSLLALFEVRMSPQLNTKVYGFFSGGSFLQQMRGGGYRPVVFMQHGLWLAIFIAMAMLAAAALWRHARQSGGLNAVRWSLATGWLLATLLLSNSLGAFVIGLMFLVAVFLLGVRGQLLFAAFVSGAILFYPMLRGAGLVPIQTALKWTASIDQDRAGSLGFRFRNEDILLDRANEKPLAGWGSWGRNRIYDEKTGGKVSTTDGMWIITVGSWGWLGYISRFGLLVVPILLLAFNRRTLDLSFATSGLALILSANLLDMIPNATLTPLTWLIGGALAGRYSLALAVAPLKTVLREARHTGRTFPEALVTTRPVAHKTSSAQPERRSPRTPAQPAR